MATVQLLGRGTYGPEVSMVHPLWSFFQSPPAQNSVIVYNDGSVVEGAIFSNDDTTDSTVNYFIQGGTDFRTDVGSFLYNSLTAAGYTWRTITARDAYSDKYEDVY
jgi:hypothetical protein